MKTNTIIAAAVLSLQVTFLFAENDKVSTPPAKETAVTMVKLAPVTPSEATFEEITTVTVTSSLMPVTPLVADFGDSIEITRIDVNALAPKTPTEANFE